MACMLCITETPYFLSNQAEEHLCHCLIRETYRVVVPSDRGWQWQGAAEGCQQKPSLLVSFHQQSFSFVLAVTDSSAHCFDSSYQPQYCATFLRLEAWYMKLFASVIYGSLDLCRFCLEQLQSEPLTDSMYTWIIDRWEITPDSYSEVKYSDWGLSFICQVLSCFCKLFWVWKCMFRSIKCLTLNDWSLCPKCLWCTP